MKEESKRMDSITNAIITAVSKPVVGTLSGFGGGLSAVLLYCHIIGVISGAIGAVFGAIVAVWHFYFFCKKVWRTRHIKDEYVCCNAPTCQKRKELDIE